MIRTTIAAIGIGAAAALTGGVAACSSPSNGSHSPSSGSHSPSYQAGYMSGASGAAHNFLVETGTGTNGPDVAAESACGVAWTGDPSIDETDWQQGCHDGLRDHPVTNGGFGTNGR